MASASTARYTTVAIALHWLIAAAIVTQLSTGVWMTGAIKNPATQQAAYQTYQFHKSLGLTILLLSVARLGWRLAHPPPPLPPGVSAWESVAAHATHWTFYALMIGMPLVGWAMVSASPLGLPTIVFGTFEWPHIPPLAALEDKKPVEAALKSAHTAGGFTFIALLALHVGAVLKHHLMDSGDDEDVMRRMIPGGSANSDG